VLAVRLTLDEGTLGAADGRQIVVGRQRGADLGRADVERGHFVGFQQMRIAKVRAPMMSARCTPWTDARRGCTTRVR